MPAKLICLFVMERNEGGVRAQDLSAFLHDQSQILVEAALGDHGHGQVIEALKDR